MPPSIGEDPLHSRGLRSSVGAFGKPDDMSSMRPKGEPTRPQVCGECESLTDATRTHARVVARASVRLAKVRRPLCAKRVVAAVVMVGALRHASASTDSRACTRLPGTVLPYVRRMHKEWAHPCRIGTGVGRRTGCRCI